MFVVKLDVQTVRNLAVEALLLSINPSGWLVDLNKCLLNIKQEDNIFTIKNIGLMQMLV